MGKGDPREDRVDDSDDVLRVRAYEHVLEALAIVDLLYLRRHAGTDHVPEVGPSGASLKLSERGRRVVVGKRSSDCGCAVHSTDDVMLDVGSIVEDPRAHVLVEEEDVAAWRCAELRHLGRRAEVKLVRLASTTSATTSPTTGRLLLHYRVVVLHADGVEEKFGSPG